MKLFSFSCAVDENLKESFQKNSGSTANVQDKVCHRALKLIN